MALWLSIRSHCQLEYTGVTKPAKPQATVETSAMVAVTTPACQTQSIFYTLQPMDPLIVYLSIGVLAGILAGLLGVGGGLVIVPALAFHFVVSQTVTGHVMHLAIGTSLATIVVTGLSSVIAHHRHGAVDWPVVFRLAPGLAVGALLGAGVADRMATASLQSLFGVFEIAVAIQIALELKPASRQSLPGPFGFAGAGGLIGVVSSLMGIGGGTLTVPFLVWCGVVIRKAVAISSACGVPIALAGAVGFAIHGWGKPGLPSSASGYIYWPAFIGISITSVVTAPLGAKLAHTLPADLLRKIFAGFLVLVGLKMLYG